MYTPTDFTKLFVVDLEYRVPLSEIDRHLDGHRAFLERHYAAGRFLASGPKQPRTGGVILAREASRDALLAALAEDPFHRNALADITVTEFEPRMKAAGLADLL